MIILLEAQQGEELEYCYSTAKNISKILGITVKFNHNERSYFVRDTEKSYEEFLKRYNERYNGNTCGLWG